MLSTITIGSDHAGFHLKAKIIEVLNNQGINTIDKGCYSEDSVDYPDIAHGVAEELHTKKASRGIVICGSGNGINMSANNYYRTITNNYYLEKHATAVNGLGDIFTFFFANNILNEFSADTAVINSQKATSAILASLN